MANPGVNPPLDISKEAYLILKLARLTQKKDTKRIRVRSKPDIEAASIAFDMFFDAEEDPEDMVYKLQWKDLELILDNDTAYDLVGSVLEIDKEGEFIFRHWDFNKIHFDRLPYN